MNKTNTLPARIKEQNFKHEQKTDLVFISKIVNDFYKEFPHNFTIKHIDHNTIIVKQKDNDFQEQLRMLKFFNTDLNNLNKSKKIEINSTQTVEENITTIKYCIISE